MLVYYMVLVTEIHVHINQQFYIKKWKLSQLCSKQKQEYVVLLLDQIFDISK